MLSKFNWNLHYSNKITSRSKIAKIVPIQNKKRLRQWSFWKSIFDIFSQNNLQIYSKLMMEVKADQ